MLSSSPKQTQTWSLIFFNILLQLLWFKYIHFYLVLITFINIYINHNISLYIHTEDIYIHNLGFYFQETSMALLGSSQIVGNSSSVKFPASFPAWRRCSSRRSVGFRVFASETQGEPDLSVTVNGLNMPNPFVIGSGPPGTNYKVMKKAFDEGWGAVIAKTVCILPLV